LGLRLALARESNSAESTRAQHLRRGQLLQHRLAVGPRERTYQTSSTGSGAGSGNGVRVDGDSPDGLSSLARLGRRGIRRVHRLQETERGIGQPQVFQVP